MDQSKPKTFRLLSDVEFWALTTQGRIAYLQQAMEVRNKINRQIDAEVTKTIPPRSKR
jgi:hypothetical protein